MAFDGSFLFFSFKAFHLGLRLLFSSLQQLFLFSSFTVNAKNKMGVITGHEVVMILRVDSESGGSVLSFLSFQGSTWGESRAGLLLHDTGDWDFKTEKKQDSGHI